MGVFTPAEHHLSDHRVKAHPHLDSKDSKLKFMVKGRRAAPEPPQATLKQAGDGSRGVARVSAHSSLTHVLVNNKGTLPWLTRAPEVFIVDIAMLVR